MLSSLGLKIVRFQNDEVVRNLSAVVGKIRELIIHPSHLPRTTYAG
ncbi:MAG: DUF559 domain-containing protein [Chloroflexota bacterium]